MALGYASAGRILSIINIETDLDQNSKGYAGELHGDVVFEHVDFGYAVTGNQVLHDVSFHIEPGQDGRHRRADRQAAKRR